MVLFANAEYFRFYADMKILAEETAIVVPKAVPNAWRLDLNEFSWRLSQRFSKGAGWYGDVIAIESFVCFAYCIHPFLLWNISVEAGDIK